MNKTLNVPETRNRSLFYSVGTTACHRIPKTHHSVSNSFHTRSNSVSKQYTSHIILLASDADFASGKLRNDIWIGQIAGSQSSWQVDDRHFTENGLFNPALIQSQMTWSNINPGRVPPPFWATDEQHPPPLTNDEWIACQDSIKHKLVDPSICNEPPVFCYEDIKILGCNEQAVWKKDNMWSPRRGFSAAVANGKIFVIGGRAREYARISDSRLIGDIAGRGRVETSRDHSTIREDVMLKNDVWSSEDEGRTWKLVSNPGCEDHQQDVLLDTEVWSRNSSNPSFRQNVGSIGSLCFLSSDCHGIAECKDLANKTNEKVCVCPMFSPREHHSLSVQRRYSVEDDGTIIEEDIMYVVGGFTSIKQSFCGDRACGPSDGYTTAMNDIWMSSDGVTWMKSAFDNSNNFTARGKHTSLVVPMSFRSDNLDMRDRLLIFGGETAHPKDLSTTFFNDVWELPLPHQPCCKSNTPCASDYECMPSISELKLVTSNATWSARSGHTTIYEPPSSSNLFQPTIYLNGGSNQVNVHADVWSWRLDEKEAEWQSLDAIDSTNLHEFDSYLSIDSPLPRLKIYKLPEPESDGFITNFTAHSSSDIMNSKDFDIMSLANVSTIRDLATADLYTVLKLRGFDYPGRITREVENVCLLREIAIAFVEKCTLKESPSSHFHTAWANANPLQKPSNVKSSSVCGRGGEDKPCTEKDWDGCSPMEDVKVVDVNGLGNVDVPQIHHKVTRIVEELFCQQVPDGRALGAGIFVSNKAVILGGIDSDRKLLYRDVWARDEESPRAIIKTMPASFTPQFTFSFDSNEDGAHVFEYKLFRDREDITNWTITTSSIGADVSWLDDKKGGPGKGWYTLFVRAVDPAGNRDKYFSTQTNVYRWYYIPPVPWGAVSGGILTGLVLIIGGYFEYHRRRKKAILEKFALRR